MFSPKFIPPRPPQDIERLLKKMDEYTETLKREYAERVKILTEDNVVFKETMNKQFLNFVKEVEEYKETVRSTVAVYLEALDSKYGSVSGELQDVLDKNAVDYETSLKNALNAIEDKFNAMQKNIELTLVMTRENVNKETSKNIEETFAKYRVEASTNIEETFAKYRVELNHQAEQTLLELRGFINDYLEKLEGTFDETVSTKLNEKIASGEIKGQIETTGVVGQTVIIKEVDENGKPTAWESVDYQPRTHYVDGNGNVHKIDSKYIDADWMATSTSTGGDTIIIPQQSTTGMWSNLQTALQPGLMYDVYINGTRYVCECHDNDGSYFIGNSSLVGSNIPHNNEPFAITWAGGSATAGMFFKDSTLTSPVKIKVTDHLTVLANTLPVHFLPDEVALKTDIPESTGGGANIDVVAKVGQTICVKEVDANGKPTAWESAEYQPRTHWMEEGQEDIVKELTFTAVLNESMGVYQHPLAPFELVEGKTYTVIFDDVSYVCTSFTGELSADNQFVAIGNAAVAGGANTGEPFVLGVFDIMVGEAILSRNYMLACFDENEHTVRVIEDKIVPHKLSDVYVTPSVFNVSIGTKGESDSVLLTPWKDIINAVSSGKTIYLKMDGKDFEWDNMGHPITYEKVSWYICVEAKVGTNSLRCSLKFAFTGNSSGTVTHLILARDENGVTTFS